VVGDPACPIGAIGRPISRSHQSRLAQCRFPAYLGPFPDHLLPDRCLDRADHPPLRSGSFTAIGSVRPMIGKGPIGLWGLSKRFIATTSGLIGVIDRFGSRKVASGLCTSSLENRRSPNAHRQPPPPPPRKIQTPSACGWHVSLCSSRIACKKEHRRSSCTNALPSNDASPLEVPAAQNPNGMLTCTHGSSRGCIWRRVESANFASASPFVGLVLPTTRHITASIISK
jgi:hypothetical protein